MEENGGGSVSAVGHSIGGFLPGLAEAGPRLERMLTVGAQYAWWGDYAPTQCARLFLKGHVVMPLASALCGHFPGKRFGWLEGLPAGVAYEWSFRGPRFERSYPRRAEECARQNGSRACVHSSRDPVGRPARDGGRGPLATMPAWKRQLFLLHPADYGRSAIGHFNLFHDVRARGFWLDTLLCLRDGRNPWPDRTVAPLRTVPPDRQRAATPTILGRPYY